VKCDNCHKENGPLVLDKGHGWEGRDPEEPPSYICLRCDRLYNDPTVIVCGVCAEAEATVYSDRLLDQCLACEPCARRPQNIPRV